jgi:hypothetical protein
LVAFLTGLLTFLNPDKRAAKYMRAWSILNTAITRYNADVSYTLNDVLEAYHQGEAIIHETSPTAQKKPEPVLNKPAKPKRPPK